MSGRRTVGLTLALVFALASVPAAAGAQGVEAARSALATGDYQGALRALAPLTRNGEASVDALRLHARALAETGEHAEALGLLGGRAPAPSPHLETLKGDILMGLGRWDEAEAAYTRAVEGDAGDASLALLRRAELMELQGRREEAFQVYDGFIDLYNQASRLSGDDLLAIGLAVARLGQATPVLFQDALRALDEAAQASPDDPRIPVATGELFLSKYNATEAHASFREVLSGNGAHPDALLGEARALDFDGDGSAIDVVRRALETNPEHAEARAFLARLHLRAEGWDEARAEAERALATNPRSLEALSVLAATHRLRGDEAAWRATRDRALALNPGYADLYVTAAELAVDHRKYDEAVELATEAIRRDSLSWQGWGLRGMNRLRTGELATGRVDLERAFEGDPYNPWFKNTLDLLDTFDEYETVETEHFQLVLHGREAGVLAPYLTELAEEAYAALRARYGAEPPTPIRLEVFPRHADFSVRTLGLVGLGALGVSFGSTLVMDSPAAREPGDFNWESVFWHELAHAFHLGMTDHNVPRWFSEGLAVREQRVARPWWGHRAGVAFLQAYQAGRMPPVSRLNEAFVRPEFPGQVVLAYLQSSLVFDWMEEEHGFDAVRAFLAGYREGEGTEALTREVLGLSAGELDDAFDAYVRERFRTELRATASTGEGLPGLAQGQGPAAVRDLPSLRQAVRRSPGDFAARLGLGHALLREGQAEEAEEHLRRALELFPGYGGPDGPLRALATVHQERGELAEAAEALRRMGELGENLYQVHLDEAELRRELGDAAGERAALARAIEIHPYDMDLHRRLAELAAAAGDHETAVRERRAILALEPADRADAHYRLAVALSEAGRADEAREAVVRALEIAPGFEAALDLLLELRGGGT